MVLTPVLRPAPKGLKYVMIRIHNGGTSPKYKSLGYKISEKNWNKTAKPHRKNWVKTTENRHREINYKIDDTLQALLNELEGKTPKKILAKSSNNAVGGKKKYLLYARNYIKTVRNQSTRTSNEQSIAKLEKYLAEQDKLYLSFDDIDKTFCKMYYNWLLEQYTNTSTNHYFGVFRTIYNDAVNDDKLGIEVKSHPFQGFKYEKNKTINEPLTVDEFDNLKYYQTQNRNHVLTRNMWLFQFSNAFRINEVICLKWKNLKWVNHEFILDVHTSKTTVRVYRQLEADVVELLAPAIERYYPEISGKHQNIYKRMEDLQKTYREMLDYKTQPMTAEDILVKLNSGYSPAELQKEVDVMKSYNEFLQDWEKDMNDNEMAKRFLFRHYLEKLRTEHANDFVWDKPQQERFDNERMNKEDFRAYKRCLGSNHGYLQRIQKYAGIKTNLSSHVARYTASQFMFNSGMDFNQISQFLTHSSHGTTEKYIRRLGVNSGQLSKFLATKLKME